MRNGSFVAKVTDIVDAEPVKPDKHRPFDDFRTLRVIKGQVQNLRDDEHIRNGNGRVEYRIFEARKRFDLDSSKPTRTTIPLRCTVQVLVKHRGARLRCLVCGHELNDRQGR